MEAKLMEDFLFSSVDGRNSFGERQLREEILLGGDFCFPPSIRFSSISLFAHQIFLHQMSKTTKNPPSKWPPSQQMRKMTSLLMPICILMVAIISKVIGSSYTDPIVWITASASFEMSDNKKNRHKQKSLTGISTPQLTDKHIHTGGRADFISSYSASSNKEWWSHCTVYPV